MCFQAPGSDHTGETGAEQRNNGKDKEKNLPLILIIAEGS